LFELEDTGETLRIKRPFSDVSAANATSPDSQPCRHWLRSDLSDLRLCRSMCGKAPLFRLVDLRLGGYAAVSDPLCERQQRRSREKYFFEPLGKAELFRTSTGKARRSAAHLI